MKKQQLLYNRLFYAWNQCSKKLARLKLSGKNLRKQEILSRRIVRLFFQLTQVRKMLQKATVLSGLTGAFSLLPAAETKAQTAFAPEVLNPFGLTYHYLNFLSIADLDNDGDFDILKGDTTASFIYFENTGTASSPAFAAPVTNPFSLSSTPGFFTTPALADLDGDGDLDLMSGSIYGDFYYYPNVGTASAPSFGAMQTNPFASASPGYVTFPSFADLDNDGDLDMMVGEYYGSFYYYPNSGTTSVPSFDLFSANPFSLAAVPQYIAAPSFADLDNDGDSDLLSGAYDGNLYYYQNTGTAAAPSFATQIMNPYGLTNCIYVSTPQIIDLDNDGDLDAMVGDIYGNFHYFECTSPVGIHDSPKASFTLGAYPNPTNGLLTITTDGSIPDKIVFTDAAGRELLSFGPSSTRVTIDMSPYENGLYIVKVINGTESGIVRVAKR